ncbi:MAG: PPC domain-containing DNA-binding protein [Candidatus Margulisiibacteriota bacterium]
MLHIELQPAREFMGRFEKDDDLLASLTAFCREQNIKQGVFNLIGAVQNAYLGYYDQEKQAYTTSIHLDQKLEITACMGNISIKDGEIMVHAHITLSDYDGKAYGGHLCPETSVFAAEFHIRELIGEQLVRGKDPKTGLPLWTR